MAKLKDFSKLTSDELNKLLRELESPEFTQFIGNQIVQDIVKRTKLGYGVSEPEGAQSPLKPLSDVYKKQRKKSGKLDSTTSPSKSNLTNTGEMLRDLKTESKGTVVSVLLGSELSRKKEQWNRESGRTFFNISGPQVKKIVDIVKKKIKEVLKN